LKKKLKILAIQETDWIERYSHPHHHILERLSKNGHEIHVIDYPINWWQKRNKFEFFKTKKIKVKKIFDDSNLSLYRPLIIPLPVISRLSSIFTHSRAIFYECRNLKPDIILLFSITNSIPVHFFSKIHDIPVVFFSLDILHKLQNFTFLSKIALAFEKFALINSESIIVVNKGLYEYIKNIGINENKIYEIPMGITNYKILNNSEIRKKYRNNLQIKDNQIVLLFMGFLYFFNGLQILLHELKASLRKDITVLLIGEGEASNLLKSIVNSLNLSNQVIFTGKVPHAEIKNYLLCSDICISPMISHPATELITPVKLYEYIVSGKPVILTRLKGVFSQFKNIPGFFFVNNPHDVIKAVPNNMRELEVLKVEAEKGRKIIIENNNYEVVVKKFLSILKDTIEKFNSTH
jgi:glycosyltransferase involved in cell wall biosynthesis